MLMGDASIESTLATAVGDEAVVAAVCGAACCALFDLDFEPYCFMSISNRKISNHKELQREILLSPSKSKLQKANCQG